MDKEELITEYFEGSLSDSQLTEFEELLKTDAEFKSAYEFEKELQLGLKKEERKEIKALLSSLNSNEKKNESKVISMRAWLIAASFALLIAIGSWLFVFNTSDLDTEQLYASNFEPYTNVIQPIERGNQLEDLKSRAFTAYENEEYPKALELFKELYEKHNDSYIDFYSAIVLMQLDRHEESIPLLKNYIENNGQLKDRALWYMSLSYLKLNQIDNCKNALEKLIQAGSFKTDAATKLLEYLG